ncbi:helix-turn-helix domain-containing protein, partial [Vibrio coralliirubri]
MSFYLLNQNLLFNSQSGKLLNLTSLQETQLRSNEWKLLSLFIEHSGSDLTSAFILEAIWESTRAKSSVATAVKNLRAQLGDSSEQPK